LVKATRVLGTTLYLAGILLCTAPLVGCGGGSPPAALQVATVAYSEFELGALTPDQRRELETLTRFGVLVAGNELTRLAEPFIERELQSRLLRRMTREVALREAGYGETELRSLYRDTPEYELVVRHLVILSERWRPEEHRIAAKARAAEALRSVGRGVDFSEVAAEYSEEPGASSRGGLLGAGRRGTWVDEFWDAASSLEVGEVSAVTETPYGYHLIKLEERRTVPFDEVRDQVIGRLVDLNAIMPAAEAWAAGAAASIELDEAAIAEWRGGGRSEDAILASWPGGGYRGEHFHSYALTLAPDALARIETAEFAVFMEVIGALARNALLVEQAAELGLELSGEDRRAVLEPVLARYQELGAALGFKRGAPTQAVKAAALEALAPRSQTAQIARNEVLDLAPAIRRLIH
jgi:hypothetical protein